MCNDYRLKVDVASIVEDFADLKIKIRFGEGAPNLESRDDVKITDMGPIVRTIDAEPYSSRRFSAQKGHDRRPENRPAQFL